MRITEVLQTSVAGAEPVISTIFDGKRRKLYKKVCKICGQDFWIPRHIFDETQSCSRKCRDEANRIRINVICAQCGKEFSISPSKMAKSKSGLYFCTRSCKDHAQRLGGIVAIQPSHYKDGCASYRERALRTYGAKCRGCGYDEYEEMLDANHRDGNRKNNKIENLEVLCVWCHAWETRMVQKLKKAVA